MDEDNVKLISDVVILDQRDTKFLDICVVRCFNGFRFVMKINGTTLDVYMLEEYTTTYNCYRW